MRAIIAITSQNKKTITKHAGQCKNYLIYTIDQDMVISKKVLELTETETLHNTFHGIPNKNPKSILFDVDILLTGSIGKGAINRLARQNVTAYIVKEKDPEIAVQNLIKGTLEIFAPISHEDIGCNHDHHHHHHH